MPEPAQPFGNGVHVYPLRVYYEDTDAGGVVYYANYLKFTERARTEMLRDLGIDHSELMDNEGVAFAVRHCTMDFLAPARLDDVLEVRTKVLQVSAATVEAEQVVRRARSSDLVRLKARLVCVNRAGRPVRLPRRVIAALQSLSHQPLPMKRA